MSLYHVVVGTTYALVLSIWGYTDNRRDVAVANRQAYAKTHGYGLFVFEEQLQVHRQPHWSKVIALFLSLNTTAPRYEWVWHLDSDAYIMNLGQPLTSLTAPAMAELGSLTGLLITKDCRGLNSGSFLLRNGDWGLRFLKSIWNAHGPHVPTYGFLKDQSAFWWLFDQDEDVKNHTVVLPQHSMNSYPLNCCIGSESRPFMPGDLTVHFPGRNKPVLEDWFPLVPTNWDSWRQLQHQPGQGIIFSEQQQESHREAGRQCRATGKVISSKWGRKKRKYDRKAAQAGAEQQGAVQGDDLVGAAVAAQKIYIIKALQQ